MDDIFGPVTNPLTAYGDVNADGRGLIGFISNILKTVALVGGIWALLNIVISGFEYISSGHDPKATQKAWARITNSLIGLTLIVGSFAIAAILGIVLYGDATYILSPSIYGPGQ